MDIREASGAVVCGWSVASGSHGAGGGFSTSGARGTSLVLDSVWRCFTASGALALSSGALRRTGLLVLDTSVSLVVTWTFSVRRSSTTLLVGRGLPEADRLWEVDAELCVLKLGFGDTPDDAPCLRGSRSALDSALGSGAARSCGRRPVWSVVDMREREDAFALSVPALVLEDMVAVYIWDPGSSAAAARSSVVGRVASQSSVGRGGRRVRGVGVGDGDGGVPCSSQSRCYLTQNCGRFACSESPCTEPRSVPFEPSAPHHSQGRQAKAAVEVRKPLGAQASRRLGQPATGLRGASPTNSNSRQFELAPCDCTPNDDDEDDDNTHDPRSRIGPRASAAKNLAIPTEAAVLDRSLHTPAPPSTPSTCLLHDQNTASYPSAQPRCKLHEPPS